MKTKLALYFILPFGLQAFATDKTEVSLCKDSEVVVFNCQIKKKTASICASKSKDAKDKFMQYRFGTSKKLELSIPEKSVEGISVGNMMYSGGGGEFISFKNSETNYVAFSKTTNDGEASGVYIEKSGKKIASLKCRPTTEIKMASDEITKYGISKAEDPGYDF